MRTVEAGTGMAAGAEGTRKGGGNEAAGATGAAEQGDGTPRDYREAINGLSWRFDRCSKGHGLN